MKNEIITVEISNEVVVEVQSNEKHEWVLSGRDVAEGYGLSASGLRNTKSRYSDEFEEGKHFVVVPNRDAENLKTTMWTKKGVIRLGFLIKTPLAKQFRDWAEHFIIKKSEEPKAPVIPQNFSEALKLAYEQSLMIEHMKPKVELYDDLMYQNEDTYNDITITDVAKALGYKPNAEFIPMLRETGIIYKNSTKPKAEYANKWFRGTPVNKKYYAGIAWKVTPKGMAGMLAKFGRKSA